MSIPKHVLIVERDPETLSLVASALRASGYATSEASTGREALRAVQVEKPDLAIVGLVLPDIGGRDLARILESNGDAEPLPTIVAVTADCAHDEFPPAEGAPERRVVHWKHVDEVVTLVNELFDLSEGKDPDLFARPIARGDVKIDPRSMSVEVDGVHVELTKREFRFLQVLAVNEDRTCTREELKRLVWGPGADVIGRTVDVLVSRLRSKLMAATGREIVATVRGIGYRFMAQ